MTNQEFNAAFKPFLDYFPTTEMTKEKINIYYLALSDLSKEQLGNAFISMVKNRVYKNFPQVAEIRQYATNTTESELEDRIVLARQIMKNAIVRYGYYSSVEFEDKGIHAVIDALDGWQKVCSMSADELEKFLTFEFPKIYKAYSRNNYQVTKSYIGYHDAMNGVPNINMISFKNMGKSLENINNRVQSLNYKASLLEDKDKEIKKLKEETEAKFFEAEYNDLCIYSYECHLGHKTNFSIGIKFQTLFHIAISALKDGYYREAVASATSALERFYELIIKIFLKKAEIDYDIFETTWKKVENLSERQIGAFYFLYLEHIKEVPQEFKGTSFRNKVVHKGKIPTKVEAEKYVKEVYDYIMNIKIKIKDKFKKFIEEVIEEERKINSKKFLELHRNEKISGFMQPGRGYFIDLLIDTEDDISFEQKYERSQKGTVFY